MITTAVYCILPPTLPPNKTNPEGLGCSDDKKLDKDGNPSPLSNNPTNRKFEFQSALSSPNSASFFYGTDRGVVLYADDLGHCTEVQQLTSSIDIMLFYEEKARLVIITRSLMLTQYQVVDNGRVSRLMQVKLSIAGMYPYILTLV